LGESIGDSQYTDDGDEERERFEFDTERLRERRCIGAGRPDRSPVLGEGWVLGSAATSAGVSSVKLLAVESRFRWVL
jgi:hypothetical protein